MIRHMPVVAITGGAVLTALALSLGGVASADNQGGDRGATAEPAPSRTLAPQPGNARTHKPQTEGAQADRTASLGRTHKMDSPGS